ncbi:arabinose efflux permease family protein [Caldisphaera lagunensis DSM 15908]|uniref:Arabinose efflux permease family protein n=1 Tax=Caldisphaera lagunensis (strain DSM 15908 / JCM 11604 / ANMR 0165 / IC-154) TaxID=1056495 RepID=L0ABL3_CALLD|nr:MFS transporter [Caldisphaera lagunensis]AFZ70517.1 arabinose efflux permease family protein [Caldisphaera lagunensis DSM 15908]
MENFTEIDKKSKINKYQWIAIISASITMFIWGFLLALAPIATQWPFVPPSDYTYLLVAAPTSLLIGNLVLGRYTDKFGRKKLFIIDMILFAISIPLILLSNNVVELGLGIGMAEFSLGGDETTVLTYLSEISPKNHRGKIIVGVTNIANFGALIAALLSIVTSFSIYIQRLSFGILLALSIPVIVITRALIPESFRWEYYKNVVKETKVEISKRDYTIRLYFLVSMAITIVLTYALMALIIGPYLFPRLTSWIIFIYNLGETIGGIILIPFVDSFSRKIIAFIAYLGGSFTMALFIPQFLFARSIIAIFMALLFLNGLFGELGWAFRVIFEPELFPTNIRATGIGLVRAIAYSLYVGSIFLTSGFSEFTYIFYNLGLWLFGLSGATLWLKYGIETKKKSLEDISDIIKNI